MVNYSGIPKGNWKKPINLNFSSTRHGEIRVPFIHYLSQPNASRPNAPLNASFPQFTLLPPELQLRIIQYCEKSTLFQLLHTSSLIRAEAAKLLFSDPKAIYWIDAKWLLEGGYSGDTLYDLEFMKYVEHLYIDFLWMHEQTWMNRADWGTYSGTEEEAVTGAYGDMDNNIKKFWGTVQHRFPRLKHVMLGDDHDRSSLQVPPIVFTKVGEMSPASIQVSLALFHRGDGSTSRRLERGVWQRRLDTYQADVDPDAKARWIKHLSWKEPLVTIPYRVLNGPVGKFQDFYIRQEQQDGQQWATRVYKIAAVEKGYLDLDTPDYSFCCSVQGCDAVFKQPEEYTSHAIETAHDKKHPLPEAFQNLFSENGERHRRLFHDISKRRISLKNWWGREGSLQRQAAKKEVIHQLENDVLLYAHDKSVLENKWLRMIHFFLGEVTCATH
ncbi:hypothetical protein DM02DRAFT_733124 [Periconia macrospinosa]|uniref:C2H2-type domain-containing protein n=1 Tax=Periconia macrospinosa TaxID=97972 RepID=A0A2V1D5X8_9PLEO|nr:hypothetical protein DM02DRAFT_733124 [Periconia macrospinosa]